MGRCRAHSRGGLVLRNLVERRGELGAFNFRCRRAILVAAPNLGTPLASPDRIGQLATWLANLVDGLILPWLDAGSVAFWISWLARLASKSAPGLGSMEPEGDQVATLQRPSNLGASPYSALTSNFAASGALLSRVLDLGIDQIFGTANDLVVPTEGGWRVDGDSLVPPERIGCFGQGGNIDDRGEPVPHIGFFERPETTKFLVECLLDGLPRIDPIDPAKLLPFSQVFRGAEIPRRPILPPTGRPEAEKAVVEDEKSPDESATYVDREERGSGQPGQHSRAHGHRERWDRLHWQQSLKSPTLQLDRVGLGNSTDVDRDLPCPRRGAIQTAGQAVSGVRAAVPQLKFPHRRTARGGGKHESR